MYVPQNLVLIMYSPHIGPEPNPSMALGSSPRECKGDQPIKYQQKPSASPYKLFRPHDELRLVWMSLNVGRMLREGPPAALGAAEAWC